MAEQEYIEKNIFMSDINNMGPKKNPKYKENLLKLNNFVLFKWLGDTVVVPRESEVT